MSTAYLLCTMPAIEEQNLEQRIICPRCLLHEERDALPGIGNKGRPSAPIIHRGTSNLLNKPRLNNVLAQSVERKSERAYAITTPPVVCVVFSCVPRVRSKVGLWRLGTNSPTHPTLILLRILKFGHLTCRILKFQHLTRRILYFDIL